jgi:FemAB-related protein (PEP-CTERM system-associated)
VGAGNAHLLDSFVGVDGQTATLRHGEADSSGAGRQQESMNIRPLQADLEAHWDEYVLQHPDATPFHLSAWKRVVEREFAYEPRYLLAEEGGRIQGVLPLFLVSNLLQGRALISSPFAVYGGICADNQAAEELLRQAACQMGRQERVEYVELRERRLPTQNGFLIKQLYVTFECALQPDPDAQFRQLPKDTRYMVRKGQRNGLRVVTDQSQLGVLHDIYAETVRRLGSPVFSKRYFRTLCEEFGEAAEISVTWQGDKALAAVLSLRFRDALLPYHGGSRREGQAVGANNFLYWELMREACQRGLRTYDFGRSKVGTGSHFFKTQWNMQEKPLPYQYYLVRRKALPNFSPANPRFKFAIALWKHVPLPMTKAIGPALVRLFP